MGNDISPVWVRINENGRIVVPAAMREALGIRSGEELHVRVEDGELRVSTMRQRLENARRILRQYVKPGVSLADELIRERRRSARDE